MLNEYTGQIIFVVLMALLLVFVLPMIQSRTGKSFWELLFGGRKGPLGGPADGQEKPRREPRISNGTKGELTAFIARLLRFANGHGMALVCPGSIRHGGETASLTAILVTPAKLIGIQCLGFGGAIAPARGNDPWKQHINGQDLTFDSPAVQARDQLHLLRAAAAHARLTAPSDVVTVFTNGRASFPAGMPDKVFLQEEFFRVLKEDAALQKGSLDVRAAALVLADMAGIRRKKG